MTRTNPIALALCLAALALPALAQSYALRQGVSADPSKAVTSASVPYADVDLASSAGARALLLRIETAADAVCRGAPRGASRYDNEDFQACRSAAISGAVGRARSPVLAALTQRRRAEARAAR